MRDHNFLTENNVKHFWQPTAHPAQSLNNPPPIFVDAEGVNIIDHEGNSVIDAIGGLWNVNLGYSCEPVKAAMAEQLQKLPYYSVFRGSSTGPTTEISYELAQFFAPDGLTKAFFTQGGSDSVETALRLTRQYHKLKGEAERYKFISFKRGYHGSNFGAASVNGVGRFRYPYEPLLPGTYHIPTPYTYRNPFDETDPARLAQLIAQMLEDEIIHQGPQSVAAFIMEPILGAGGVFVPHETLMPMIREICDRYGVLLIADEVITAFGRTGAWTGSRLWGVKPDLMATAKAVTNAFFPFGATMLSEKVVDVFESNTDTRGVIGHGYTNSGHPVGAAAALACLAEIKRLNVIDNAAKRGTQLFEGVQALMAKHELVGDVRGGKGLMTSIEVVSDRAAKTPANPQVMDTIQKAAYEDGVMLRTSGNIIILSPPLIVTDAECAKILSALDTGLSAAANIQG